MSTAPTATVRRQYRITNRYSIVQFAERVLRVRLWDWQRVIVKVIYALPLDESEGALLSRLTDSVYSEPYEPSGRPLGELVVVAGRRSGKSLLGSVIAIYEAFKNWTDYLRPDETGYAVCVSTRLDSAKAGLQQTVAGLLTGRPELAEEIVVYAPNQQRLQLGSTSQRLVLRNGSAILSQPCDSTASRGLPVFCLICDELAFFAKASGSPKQDAAVVNSIRPGQAQFGGRAKMIWLSSANERRGLVYEAVENADRDRDVRLVVKAPTWLCHPEAETPEFRAFLNRERERDPLSFDIEFGCRFAASSEGLLNEEAVEGCIGDYERLPWQEGVTYAAGMDPSQGTDAWAIGVAHFDPESRKVIVDCLTTLAGGRRGGRPDLESIVCEIRGILDTYYLASVLSDQFEAMALSALLQREGVCVLREDWSLQTRRECGIALRCIIDQGRLVLPKSPPELSADLLSLERTYTDFGQWTIRARRTEGRHGDLADVIQMLIRRLDLGAYQHDSVGGRFSI